ncbi:GNAT family N-acetyltransferase [Streptosporangium sp. 'caverna']|uniref:GNAT family N-acetyltransferase n=1 Tax=Streptosporangium sp. 'caverna' TaxID=2202249 RepID=UPI000D7D2E5E|nr:GNAT family N-acetyltransferase [Streptosporangium sp. 'caverna']AWS40426.1 N-acetyltransferase [Streptosporangium sp. 'caverna']
MMAPDSTEGPFPPDIRLSGLGIHLREWTDEDLPVMVALFDEPQVARWTPLRSPFDFDAAQEYLSQSRRARAADRGMQLAITRDGGEAQGEVLLFRTADEPGVAELAYAIGAQHRRERLAARAVELMAGYARTSLGMRGLVLRIDPANAASVAVAQATGFHMADEEPMTFERKGHDITLHRWRRDLAL